MAYITKLNIQCGLCPSRATHELFDRFNSSHGKYCTKCAARKLKDVLKAEEEQTHGSKSRTSGI